MDGARADVDLAVVSGGQDARAGIHGKFAGDHLHARGGGDQGRLHEPLAVGQLVVVQGDGLAAQCHGAA